MRKPEAVICKQWCNLMNLVRDVQGHERIENSMGVGTPDYCQTIGGIHSWVEFKVSKEPKRDSTKIKLPHWTQSQRLWMKARVLCPTVFLLVRIGEWDYLFDSVNMFNIETIPYGELKKHRWRIKISDIGTWSASDIELLSSRLKGVDYLRL